MNTHNIQNKSKTGPIRQPIHSSCQTSSAVVQQHTDVTQLQFSAVSCGNAGLNSVVIQANIKPLKALLPLAGEACISNSIRVTVRKGVFQPPRVIYSIPPMALCPT